MDHGRDRACLLAIHLSQNHVFRVNSYYHRSLKRKLDVGRYSLFFFSEEDI